MEYAPTVDTGGLPASIPWTFKNWIACFEKVDLPIGDLARDVAGDDDFPDDNVFEILDHLFSKGACDEARETLLDAWNFYKASTHPIADYGLEGAKYRLALEQELQLRGGTAD